MLYGIWMARTKHRLAQAIWKLSDKVSHPELDFLQRLLDDIADLLVASAAKQATKTVSKRLSRK